jgi:hypothetical protein
MARDWVKMRTELYRDPKVVLMANVVAQRLAASSCNVTRNVTRNAVVGALVTVWGILRHNGRRTDDDLVIAKGDLQMIDDISELPGMGEAMQEVEWVIRTEGGLRFPAFFSENNVDPNEDKAAKNAERQRRYRESKAKPKPRTDEENDVTRNVTRNVTGNARAEESREEKRLATNRDEQKTKPEHTGGIEEITIPQKMQTPECQAAASMFMAYLDEKGLSDKRPDGAIALQAWWAQMARIGPKDFPVMVERSIAGGHWSVKVLPDPAKDFAGPARSHKSSETNADWMQALAVCRRYPSGSQQDSEERKIQLTPEQLQAARAVGFGRIAGSTSFDVKQIEAEFVHALKGAKP